nr:S24 family peptidase [Pectobacterium parmentieri]
MTILELATSIGSDVGNVSRLETGKQGYSEQTIKKIADALGVKISDLFTEEKISLPPKKEPKYIIDVLDAEASAGNGRFASSEVAETITSIAYETARALEIFGHRPSESIKVITVTGDSMSGTIETGDYIFVDVSKDYFDGDGIYVFSFKGALLVKRLQFTADGLVVRSDNVKYSDWIITDSNEQYLKIVGRVIYSHGISRYV